MQLLKIPYLHNLKNSDWAKRLMIKRYLAYQYPIKMDIEPTNDCNLNCITCARRQSRRKVGYMKISLFKKIIDDLKGKKIIYLTLHKDGEPFLHKQIFEMISYVKTELTTYLNVTTNGLLLDKTKIQNILDTGLDDISFSVDAFHPETYKKIRRTDALNMLIENINTLISLRKGKRKPFIRLRFTIMKDNVNEVDKFKKYWQGKVDHLSFDPYHTWSGNFTNRSATNYLIPKRYPCSFLWYTFSISYTGIVTPCCVDYKCAYPLGDLNKESIAQIWSSERLKKLRSAHIYSNYSEIELCKDCTYWTQQVDIYKILKRKYNIIE